MRNCNFLPVGETTIVPCLSGGAAGVRKLFFVLFGLFNGLADFFLDLFPVSSVAGARTLNDSGKIVLWSGRDGQSGSGEGWNLFAIDNHGDNKVAVVHL